mgnify:CR=1 FL=1
MKAFINIIILGLIGLCSSTYLFNLSPIDYKGTIEIETPIEESTLSLETEEYKMLNPESITINHITSKEEVIKIVTDSIFNVDVYMGSRLIKSSLNNLELISPSVDTTISANKDNPIITALNISQKKLGLEDGTYEFKFNSNLIANESKSSVSVTVIYDTAGIYYPAVNAAPAGTKGLTLYFAAENADILIPVTRFVVEDKSITRMAIEQLQNGPLNKGLKSLIKNVTNTTYNNGNVVIDIPSTHENYNSESTEGLMSYNTFIKTIFAVERYWPIHSISFTVDRNRVETYFHGINEVNQVRNNMNNYLLFMAHKADERYYLFDYLLEPGQIGMSESDTTEIKAAKIFDAYSNTDLNCGISPVPKAVALNSSSMQGSTLILDFNENLLTAYKGRDDLRHMMIESFIYTFTTIPGVDSIKITAGGESLTGFIEGADTSNILYPPEFINPETVNATQ